MPRHSAIVAALAITLALGSSGCKRRKPPMLDHVWLGRSHGCALEKKGGLSCWGKNDEGQLGDGTKQDRRFATRTTSHDRPDALAIGQHHTCGLYGGAVRCVGQEPPSDLPPSGFTALAVGGEVTCALHPDGHRCWSPDPFKKGVQNDWIETPSFRGARLVGSGPSFLCAAFDAPKLVRCWGGAEWEPPFQRYFGNPTPPSPQGPAVPLTRPELLKGLDVVSLSTGGAHACAALADGTVMCWGANDEGQVGDGTKNLSKVPVQVVGLSGAASVHAGLKHTCARIKNGTVACWGDNHHYQLANGTTESSTTPRAMFGLTGVQEVAVGGDNSCVRLTDGLVKCWGANDVGQLGDGSTFDNSVPMPIRWNAADGATR